MNGDELRARLAERPLITDGGMGTWLLGSGAPAEEPLESMNLAEPERVVLAHLAFVEAGSGLVLTNTFGANRFRLDRHGLADRVMELASAAVPLARRSGPEPVGGVQIGPLGVRLQPYGRVRDEEASEALLEHAAALADAGVDLLVIETQTDLREMTLAIAAAREAAPDLAVMTSATFTRDDRTPLGDAPAEVAAGLVAAGADVIGVNCGEGPAQALRVIRAMAPFAAGVPLAARPNAGGPARRGGRFVYPATPDYVAGVALALLDEGVVVVGGRRGTGPDHTAALVDAIAHRAERTHLRFPAPAPIPPPGSATEGRTALATALAEDVFPVAVEMEPPRSFDASAAVAAAVTLRDAGATVVDVADSPMAKLRMSAWAACRLIQERAGIETVLHFPTRGRNLLRLQGDLLGARALGVRNLFVVVGDPVTIGDYPQALNDVDVTATGLLALVERSFNAGTDRAGSSIGAPASFFAGAAVSPLADDLEREVRLLARKVDAGARFLLSQPLYDPAPLVALHTAFERVTGAPLAIPVLAGVLPLVSARHATFLHNEVPGIQTPDAIRDRLVRAGEGPRAWREGAASAVEAAVALRDAGASGIYLMPQFGRFDRAAEVVEAIRSS